MKQTMIVAAALLVAVDGGFTGTAHAQSFTSKDGSKWWKCADEGRRCEVRGELKVAYGVQGKWRTRIVKGSVACTSQAFGGDPAVGEVKACYYMSENKLQPLAGVDRNWSHCANEGKVCRFEGERRVAYGVAGRWSYRVARHGIDCTNSRFGDPAVGQAKACYIDPNY